MPAKDLVAAMTDDVALETQGLCLRLGSLVLANSISFKLARGVCHALIGPNGAGKTTFLNLATGVLTPDSGTVLLDGQDVTRLSREARVKRGLVRSFQISSLFKKNTTLENVVLAVSERSGLGFKIWKDPPRFVIEEAYQILERLGLADDALRPAQELAYGKQRLIEIAIGLALYPKVLLLDEPAAGVPASDSGRIIEIIESLSEEISVLLIEHDMNLVFRLAKEITVLVSGSVLVTGTPSQIAGDERVREVYLGGRHRLHG